MGNVDFWFSFTAQTLLRGAGLLVAFQFLAYLIRHASAARRALVWQAAFGCLVLLPAMLLLQPPVKFVAKPDAAPAALSGPNPLPRASVGDGRSGPDAAPLRPVAAAGAQAELNPVPEPVPAGPAGALAPAGSAGRWSPARIPGAVTVAGVRACLLVLWAIGTGWSLVSVAVSLAALRRMARHGQEPPQTLIGRTAGVARQMGIRRPVALRIGSATSGLAAPITWGLARPSVMLPATYAGYPAEQYQAAIIHELAHVARADWAWLIAARIICASYWCVPIVWTSARRLRNDSEMACDDCVLAAGVRAPDYALQLVELARAMGVQRDGVPRGALSMARAPLAEDRIRAILDARRQRRPATAASLAIAALLAALVVPMAALRAEGVRPHGAALLPAAVAEAVSSPPLPTPFDVGGSQGPGAVVPPRAVAPSATALRAAVPDVAPTADRRTSFASALRAMQPAPHEPSSAAPAELLHAVDPQASARAVDGSRRSRDAATGQIAWGPVVGTLQAGLRLVSGSSTFAPGEPIRQEVYVRNGGAADVAVSAVGGYEEQGRPVVQRVGGAPVKVLQYFGMGAMFVVTTRVRPGEMGLVGRFAVAFRSPTGGPDAPQEVAPGISSSAEDMALALAGGGRYLLRQELLAQGPDGKSLNARLTTGAVPVTIAGEPRPPVPRDRNHIEDVTTAPIAWGPVRSGLQAGLMYLTAKPQFFTGERVRVAAILRNVSPSKIAFWHQTAFAFLDPPQLRDRAGKRYTVAPAFEDEWKTLGAVRMTGVTFDMSSAPSADGPSRLRQSEISPGQSVVGYYLTAFVIPRTLGDARPAPGRYQVVQPVRVGLGGGEALDTELETGALEIEIADPGGANIPPVR